MQLLILFGFKKRGSILTKISDPGGFSCRVKVEDVDASLRHHLNMRENSTINRTRRKGDPCCRSLSCVRRVRKKKIAKRRIRITKVDRSSVIQTCKVSKRGCLFSLDLSRQLCEGSLGRPAAVGVVKRLVHAVSRFLTNLGSNGTKECAPSVKIAVSIVGIRRLRPRLRPRLFSWLWKTSRGRAVSARPSARTRVLRSSSQVMRLLLWLWGCER